MYVCDYILLDARETCAHPQVSSQDASNIPKYHLKMPLIARFIDDLMCILEVGGEDGMDDNEVDNLIQDLDTFGQGTLT